MKKANMDFGITEDIFEIVIAFDLEGKILFGNKSAREKLNYSEEELEAHNMTEIFWQEFQGENQQFESFDVKKLTEKQETVMYRKNSSSKQCAGRRRCRSCAFPLCSVRRCRRWSRS